MWKLFPLRSAISSNRSCLLFSPLQCNPLPIFFMCVLQISIPPPSPPTPPAGLPCNRAPLLLLLLPLSVHPSVRPFELGYVRQFRESPKSSRFSGQIPPPEYRWKNAEKLSEVSCPRSRLRPIVQGQVRATDLNLSMLLPPSLFRIFRRCRRRRHHWLPVCVFALLPLRLPASIEAKSSTSFLPPPPHFLLLLINSATGHLTKWHFVQTRSANNEKFSADRSLGQLKDCAIRVPIV